VVWVYSSEVNVVEAGLIVLGIAAIVAIVFVVVPLIAAGRWLTALAIAIPVIALVSWLQFVAWRQKHGRPERAVERAGKGVDSPPEE